MKKYYKSIIAVEVPTITMDSTTFEFLSNIAIDIQSGEIELDDIKYILGDDNCDGEVKSNDLLLLKKYLLGLVQLDKQDLYNVDVTLDGLVRSNDLFKVKKLLLGLLTFEE